MARVDYSEGVGSVAPSGEAPDAFQRIQASPSAFGSSIAQGLEKFSEGATQAGHVWGQIQTSDAINNAESSANDLVSKYRELRGADALNQREDFEKKIEDTFNNARQGLKLSDQQYAFDQNARAFKERYVAGLIRSHADQQAHEFAQSTNSATYANGLAIIAGNPNDDESFQMGVEKMHQARLRNLQLSGLAGDQDSIQNESRQTAVDATEARIKALSPTNPKAALDVLNANQPLLSGAKNYDALSNAVSNGVVFHYEALARADTPAAMAQYDKEKDTLPAQARDRLESFFINKQYTDNLRAESAERRAEAQQRKAAATIRVGVGRQLQNATAMVSSGFAPTNLPDDDAIRSAFPDDPDRADEALQQVADLRDIGGSVAQLPNMTPEQVVAKSHELSPNPAEPQAFDKKARLFNIWNRAVEGHYKGLKDDPAGAVIGNAAAHPETSAAWTALQQIKDPQQFALTFGDYAAKTLGTQAVLGVPESQRSVLPKQVSQTIANDLESNPQQAPAKIKQLQQQYGAAWPTAWRDLVVHGKLSPMYQSVATLDDERDGALLSQWIQGGKDTKRNVAELVGGDKAFKGINDSVESSPELQSLSRSLYRSGASQSMVGNVMQSVKELAYAKAANGTPDGAEYAIKAFTSKYEFMPNGGARVPAKVFDAVTQNANALVSGLTAPDLARDVAQVAGMKKPGNLDPYNRPTLKNPDGSVSTTSSASRGTDEGEVLYPTVVDGKRLKTDPDPAKDEAWQHYLKTGEHFGIFDTPEHADAFATNLHNKQADWMGLGGKVSISVPPIFGQQGAPKPDEYIDLVKSAPTWITSPNADAIMLMDPYGRFVRDAKGQPIKVPFDAPAPVPKGPPPDRVFGR